MLFFYHFIPVYHVLKNSLPPQGSTRRRPAQNSINIRYYLP